MSAGKKAIVCVVLCCYVPVNAVWYKPWSWFGTSAPESSNSELEQSVVAFEGFNDMKPDELMAALLNVFPDTSISAHEKLWMAQTKKAAHALLGNMVCASELNEKVLEEAQTFFGKKEYAIFLDATQKEARAFLEKGYRQQSRSLMTSNLEMLTLKNNDRDDLLVIDVTNESILAQWCTVYLGNFATEKEIQEYIKACAGLLKSTHIVMSLGLCKEKKNFEPRIASLSVRNGDTLYLVRLNNLMTSDKKDDYSRDMVEQTLSLVKKAEQVPDLKKFVALSTSKQEMVFAALGLLKTRELVQYIKNK